MIKFFKECHLKVLPVMVVMIVLGFIIQRFLPVQNLILFFVKAAIWFVLYVVLLFLFVFNKFEKDLIKKVMEKFRIIRSK